MLRSLDAVRHSGPTHRGIYWPALNRVGRPHRWYFVAARTRVGCIDRPQERIIVQRSGEIHRPQFVAMKSVVKLMTLGNAWRSAKDHGRTGKCYFVNCPNLHKVSLWRDLRVSWLVDDTGSNNHCQSSDKQEKEWPTALAYWRVKRRTE